jgi:hypothetical protein
MANKVKKHNDHRFMMLHVIDPMQDSTGTVLIYDNDDNDDNDDDVVN